MLEQLVGPLPGILVISQYGNRGEMGSALCQPEMLIVGPGTVVALAAVGLLATGATMLARTPGVELESATIGGARAPVGREQGFPAGNRRHAVQYRPGPLGQTPQQGDEIRCGRTCRR